MSLRFYRCDTCGNLVVMINDSGMTPNCCGKNMLELRPGMTDGALEKHLPVYIMRENMICVTVGEQAHPMTDMHHIDFIVLETDKSCYLRRVFKEGCSDCTPQACFYPAPEEKPIAIYEYCNLHGLYVTKL